MTISVPCPWLAFIMALCFGKINSFIRLSFVDNKLSLTYTGLEMLCYSIYFMSVIYCYTSVKHLKTIKNIMYEIP